MGKGVSFLLLALVLCYGVTVTTGFKGEKERRQEREKGEEKGEEGGRDGWFLLPDSKPVLKTDAGEMRVVRSTEARIAEKPLYIGFITMEPKTLFIPQYLDSSLILFLRTGSTFYILNPGEGPRLHIICSIDPSESLNLGIFQSFFIGGGTYPTSILAGFGLETLTAFNVSKSKVRGMVQGEPQQEEAGWSWWKLLETIFGVENNKMNDKAPDSYNIYKRSPDFRNNYGWSIALDGSNYGPLKHSGVGIYLVNLTEGSMLAPHVNPRATEYGIVLSGSGRIQGVYPNGTLAIDAKVKEGDVFWVPRYFAFCQIASRKSPMEFFGFTTSSHKNHPQFLVGANSVLHTLNTPELAAAFGVSEERIRRIINAQREAVILPSPAPPEDDDKKRVNFEAVPRVIKNFGSEMILGFD
ncbi:hypothetical protein DITRI_Ditri14bG0029100 [Diplodiscus trichospermus]